MYLSNKRHIYAYIIWTTMVMISIAGAITDLRLMNQFNGSQPSLTAWMSQEPASRYSGLGHLPWYFLSLRHGGEITCSLATKRSNLQKDMPQNMWMFMYLILHIYVNIVHLPFHMYIAAGKARYAQTAWLPFQPTIIPTMKRHPVVWWGASLGYFAWWKAGVSNQTVAYAKEMTME